MRRQVPLVIWGDNLFTPRRQFVRPGFHHQDHNFNKLFFKIKEKRRRTGKLYSSWALGNFGPLSCRICCSANLHRRWNMRGMPQEVSLAFLKLNLHAQWRLPTASNHRASTGARDRPRCIRGDTFDCSTTLCPELSPLTALDSNESDGHCASS